MPLYEYYCNDCKVTFERLQVMNGNVPVTCIDCGTEAGKILSVVAAFSKIEATSKEQYCKSPIPSMSGCGLGACGAC